MCSKIQRTGCALFLERVSGGIPTLSDSWRVSVGNAAWILSDYGGDVTGHDGGQVLQIGGVISGGPAASVSCGFDEEA